MMSYPLVTGTGGTSMMRATGVTWCLLGMLVVWPQTVSALEPGQKLRRGLANPALGWMALPKNIKRCSFNGADMMNMVSFGPLNYVFCTVGGVAEGGVREIFGVLETVTFPLPWPENPYRSLSLSESPYE